MALCRRARGLVGLEAMAINADSASGCASNRSEEHTSELQSRLHLVCRLLLEKKKNRANEQTRISAKRSRGCRGKAAVGAIADATLNAAAPTVSVCEDDVPYPHVLRRDDSVQS